MAVKCPNCGAENPGNQKFCGGCGSLLDMPPQARTGLAKCPSCGFDNPEGKRFCVRCGSMIPRTPQVATNPQDQTKNGP